MSSQIKKEQVCKHDLTVREATERLGQKPQFVQIVLRRDTIYHRARVPFLAYVISAGEDQIKVLNLKTSKIEVIDDGNIMSISSGKTKVAKMSLK